MLDQLIEEGRRLFQQIQKHYSLGSDALPPGQRITVAELEAWYKGVTAALERTYGPESKEACQWRDGLATAQKESWEAVYHGDSPRGESWAVHLLAESLGTLAQIRLLRLRGRESPTSSIGFASLHPKVAESCQALFATGEYDAAVLFAFKAVEEAPRDRGGAQPTDYGVSLVSAVMNPKSPRLNFSNIPAEQEAFHSLFRGALGAFKNPLSHRSVNHSDPVRVLEFLCLASLLMRLIDDLSKIH